MQNLDFNPYSAELQREPFEVYKRLRTDTPVYYNERRGFWVISRYQDVKSAFKDHKRFSSASGITLSFDEQGRATEPDEMNAEVLIMTDEPHHKRLRDLVQRAFTSSRIQQLEPSFRKIVSELFDSFVADGECDYAQDFAAVFPATVICELLGCDQKHRTLFKRTADDLVRNADSSLLDTLKRNKEMFNVVTDHLEARKNSPKDDLTSALLDSKIDGESLSDVDLYGFIFLLLVAGTETTTNLLTNALVVLDQAPLLRRQLIGHPELIPVAIEEFLRLESPIQGLIRTTREAVLIDGVEIPEGEKVLLLIGAANRDELKFDFDDSYDLSRKQRDHLAFGYGVHFCLGASLARLEAKIAIEETLRRIPKYVICHDKSERLISGPIRGFTSLPIQF